MRHWLYCVLILGLGLASGAARAEIYAWLPTGKDTVASRFSPPAGFVRESQPADSFAAWLAGLPLKPAGAAVHLFDGKLKSRQDVHAAVIDIDVGTRDLQQCADAIMRLRGEWLFAKGRRAEIAFDYTNGARVDFARWSKGLRPSADGRKWSPATRADDGYATFKRYMTQIFVYAGTASLAKELVPVRAGEAPQIGDVFIMGGFPGHAVIVVDRAVHPATGEVRFLLAQSYMPAQEIHILRVPGGVSPWYTPASDGALTTPEWPFAAGSLRRWPG